MLIADVVVLHAESRRYQSEHFVLESSGDAGVDRILDELERAHAALREFGLDAGGAITVKLHGSTGSFARATGGVSTFTAMAVGRVVHLQPPAVLFARSGTLRTLRHELAHVALDEAARHGLPRWLNEGIAMAAGRQSYHQTVSFGSLEALEDSLQHSGSHATLRSAYAAAGHLASKLLARHSRRVVLSMLAQVAGSGRFETRFYFLTGYRPDEWAAEALETQAAR